MRARSNVAVTLSMAVMLWSRATGVALPQEGASPADRDAVLQRVGDYLDRYEQDLTAIAQAHAVSLSLVRPVVLGWILVEVREKGVVPTSARTLAITEALKHDPRILATSPERTVHAHFAPNDPLLNRMWHLEAIGAQASWDITPPPVH